MAAAAALTLWMLKLSTRPADADHAYGYTKAEVFFGAFFTDFIAFFIIVATASELYTHGINITSANDAALALKPLAGNFAYMLFAPTFKMGPLYRFEHFVSQLADAEQVAFGAQAADAEPHLARAPSPRHVRSSRCARRR